MLNEIDTSTTLVGLIFFFLVFLLVIFYVYNPKKKREMDRYGEIPLNESNEDER